MLTRKIPAIALAGCAALSAPALPDEPASAPQIQDLKLGAGDGTIAWNLYWYQACERALPTFAQMAAPVYEGWRERNRAAVTRLEALPDFQPAMERTLSARVQSATQGDRTAIAQQCTMMMIMVWEPPAVLGKTPAETWNGLMDAMRSGDASRALGFFLVQFRLAAAPRLAQMGPEGMKSIAERIKGFQLEEQSPGIAAGRVSIADHREEKIHFDYYSGDGKDAGTTGWLIERLDELWADCGRPPRVLGTGECERAGGK